MFYVSQVKSTWLCPTDLVIKFGNLLISSNFKSLHVSTGYLSITKSYGKNLKSNLQPESSISKPS